MTRLQSALRLALLPAAVPVLVTAASTPQSDVSVLIQLKQIQIQKEDDPLSNDEPYLINLGFKAQIAIDENSKPGIVPGTLSVTPVGTAVRNNLGRGGDNWANRGGTYAFDTQLFGTVIPANEPGWIVGIITAFFEEDAYSESTARDLRNRLREEVSKSIESLAFDSADARSITKSVASKVVRDIQRGAAKLNIAGIFRNLASALDPDDFGGMNMVLAMSLPQGGLMMFAGAPPDNLGEVPNLTNVPTGKPTPFTFDFPKHVPSGVPWNARYRGRCRVEGFVVRGG